MADTVDIDIIHEDANTLVVHLTNISDGTGETAVKKVDKSSYTGPSAAEPGSLDIESVRWAVQGFTSVRLLWDHTTDDVALVLCGNGYDNFSLVGCLKDPRSTGGTGDILLTTAGTTAGNTYDITLWLRKRS